MSERVKESMEIRLKEQTCPSCNSTKIGIDNWGMFEGQRDWFYYCKDCDYTF